MGHVFKHPNHYKELKASLKKKVISPDPATAESGRAPSSKPQASSWRINAGSFRPQASSAKQQAIEETVPHNDIEESLKD